MTGITAATATAASANPQQAANTAVSDAASNSLTDYDDFLTLLTTQMQNQDPLNPQDSTEFVEQIATFSSVEQLVAQTEKLDQLIAAQTGDELSALASWIGRDVVAPSAGFPFDGTSMDIDVPAAPGATQASVTIRDLEGREIASLPASPAGGAVTWDGTTASGGQASSGLYLVEFISGVATPDGIQNAVTRAEGRGKVVEARIEDGVGKLRLDNGAVINAGDVTSVEAEDAG